MRPITPPSPRPRSLIHYRYLLLCALLALAGSPRCTRRKAEDEAARNPAAQSGTRSGPSLKDRLAFLARIPSDSRTTLVVLSWRDLFRGLEALRSTLDRISPGQALLSRARSLSAGMPVPLPWTLQELSALGVDPDGLAAIYGRGRPVLILSVKDEKMVRKQLAALVGAPPNVTWSTRTIDGMTVHELSGARPMACAIADRALTCSSDSATVLSTLRQRPDHTLLSSLEKDEQRGLASAMVIMAGSGHRASGLGALRLEPDGLSARLQLQGKDLRRLASLLGTKSKGSLLGLAAGARTVLFARVNLPALFGLGRGILPGLGELGLDAVRLQSGLTGELLLMEQENRQAALVLGCSDPRISQETTDALGRLLSRRGAGKGARGSPFKVTAEDLPGGIRIQRLQIASSPTGFPLKLELGLAPTTAGIVMGSWPLVQALGRQQVPPASKMINALGSATEKEAFGKGAVLASRSYLGDPLGPLARGVDRMLQAHGLPPEVKGGMDLGRFLLDQMYSQSLGVILEAQDRVRLVLRLTTLHRDGHPEDDEARAVWIEGIKAKLQGNLDAYHKAQEELAAKHGGTRYAQLRELSQPGLLGTLLSGALSAVVIPAVADYRRRMQMTEVHHQLARIVSSAKFAYISRGVDHRGRPLPPSFPDSAPWTPAEPCCKTGGTCRPALGHWSHPTWMALQFSILEPHRYQYRFENKGKQFVAEARGDLDCDGTLSSFSIEGTLEKDGTVSLSPMKSSQPKE